MRKNRLIFLFVFLFYIHPAYAGNSQVITLKDGSQIKGQLISVSGDSYTIHTTTMGDIKINSSQIANIAASPSSAPDSGINEKIQAAQTKLTSDPHMMAEIQGMAKDPELMQMLSDPNLTQAVMSHDVQAIENNPKAKELMNNPKMRALMHELHDSASSPSQ